MKKIILGSLTAVALLVGAGTASAATISDARFSNNQTSVDATGGTTVNGTFTLTVGTGEVVEWLRMIPNGNPFTETSVGGSLGYQEGVYTNVPFTVKVPPNTGTYNVDVQGAGIYGGNRAISGADNVVVGPTTVGQVRVVASGSSDSSTGSVSVADQIAAAFASLKAYIDSKLTPTSTPATSAVCTAYAQANAGTQMNVTNSANVRLQGFLLSQGASIPALAAGASFGFYGNQTASAVAWFNSTNHCN